MFEVLRALYQDLETADMLLLLNVQERHMKSFTNALERRHKLLQRLNATLANVSTVWSLRDSQELNKMQTEALARDARILDVVTQARDILRQDWQKVSPSARLNQSPYGHKQPNRKITL